MNKSTHELKEKKSHGNPQFPLGIYQEYIHNDKDSIPLHWHEELEIAYIAKGSGDFAINLQNFHVNLHDLVLVKPGALHALYHCSIEDCYCESIVFNLDMLSSLSMDIVTQKFIMPLQNGELDLISIVTRENQGYDCLLHLFQKIMSLYASKTFTYELQIKSSLLEMITVFNQYNYIMHSFKKSHENEKQFIGLKKVIDFIHTNYSNPITLHDMSVLCGYSDYHFIRFFKSATTVTPIKYLTHYRVDQSTWLLTNTTEQITSIAYECGFNHVSYYIKCFSKRYGVTPMVYRHSS